MSDHAVDSRDLRAMTMPQLRALQENLLVLRKQGELFNDHPITPTDLARVTREIRRRERAR